MVLKPHVTCEVTRLVTPLAGLEAPAPSGTTTALSQRHQMDVHTTSSSVRPRMIAALCTARANQLHNRSPLQAFISLDGPSVETEPSRSVHVVHS